MTIDEQIHAFLNCEAFAVAGASTNRDKYGNKVLRCYLQQNKTVYPINPRAKEIEGIPCFPDIASLPKTSLGLSIITPPKITNQVVEDAIHVGIKHIWMQPGAESREAIELCKQHNINVIYGGACLLVVLRYRESF